RGGVGGLGVEVPTVVAGRGDEDVPGLGGGGQGIPEGRVEIVAAVAVVGDLGPHLDGVSQGFDRTAGGAAAIAAEELQGHDLHVPGDTRHADAVVADGADGAGDVRAVAVVVPRVAVVVAEVVAVDVVDEAIAVVVDPVTGD